MMYLWQDGDRLYRNSGRSPEDRGIAYCMGTTIQILCDSPGFSIVASQKILENLGWQRSSSF